MGKGVSVVIPVYNRVFELKRAIDSVLKQNNVEYEIIIVDDCSEADIKGVVDSYNDERIVFMRNSENLGVAASRNIGIRASKYDIFAFLDSDDEWLPNKLTTQLKYLDNSPVDVVHTEEIWIRNGVRANQKKIHKKTGGDIYIPSLRLCLMSPSSIMIKKKVFDKLGLFDESLPVCEDYDMWLRITANDNVGFIETPLIVKYGGHSDQLSVKYRAMDRYRVISMFKILNTLNLSQIKKEATVDMIKEKTLILLSGAEKRRKIDDIALYRKWLKDCANYLSIT
ncbi:MAG TPA: glycosyltransferase family A protein [Spirochaetota bacterium]|nr:glycosyltransferase family A protein [Spirochaetota bacterium]HOS32388.1 glycosyltransferase family A protein [Spirochaetota bacterium]HOS55798.1 glycosyltransferase family A protein [Spirochaetota bacterium]HQF78394.1 glycosyltransferase family A protein [Spirochaetota bacterium]HQJ05887.1 glycosyltransferase family A protein [Spirochaetota bacterium]